MEARRCSMVNFLVEEHKLNRDSFLYESNYDASTKHTLISKLYIDLGNYLSGNDEYPLVFFHNTAHSVGLVCFSNGVLSPASVNNPNDLQPDREDKTFHCFGYVQVRISPKSTDTERNTRCVHVDLSRASNNRACTDTLTATDQIQNIPGDGSNAADGLP